MVLHTSKATKTRFEKYFCIVLVKLSTSTAVALDRSVIKATNGDPAAVVCLAVPFWISSFVGNVHGQTTTQELGCKSPIMFAPPVLAQEPLFEC